MKTAKFASAALILTMLFSSMAACASDTADTPNVQTEAETTAAQTEAQTEILPPDFPDVTFDGHTVTILTANGYSDWFFLGRTEETGDALDDAAYKRDLAIEEKFDVSFAIVEKDVPSTLKRAVMADDTTYDFVVPHYATGLPGLITDNILYDWNSLDHIDMSKPWWSTSAQQDYDIKGKLYLAVSDYTIGGQGMDTFLFNKKFLKDMNLDTNMYDMVWDGTWTWDKVFELTRGMDRDLNGDGKMTEVDQYGVMTNGGTFSFVGCAGIPFTELDDNGYPVLAMNTERMQRLVDYYYDLVNSPIYTYQVYHNATYGDSSFRKTILDGRVFLTLFDITFEPCIADMRSTEYEFGIMPMPKLDEAQEGYPALIGAGILMLPANIPDPERSGVLAEAMAYYSYEYLRPAFINNVLQYKALQDEESFRVLDMLLNHQKREFAINFGVGLEMNVLHQVVVENNGTGLASYIASIENKCNEHYKNIYDSAAD